MCFRLKSLISRKGVKWIAKRKLLIIDRSVSLLMTSSDLKRPIFRETHFSRDRFFQETHFSADLRMLLRYRLT